MHTAPSVSYPVGRSRFALAALAALWLLALAAVAAWSLQVAAAPWLRAAAFAVLAACALLAARGWLRSPQGTLAWDGAGWQWQQGDAAQPGHPELALDLQGRMLVRWLAEAGPARWLWLERNAAPPHWDALRRAVYSRASTGAQQGAQPPVARR